MNKPFVCLSIYRSHLIYHQKLKPQQSASLSFAQSPLYAVLPGRSSAAGVGEHSEGRERGHPDCGRYGDRVPGVLVAVCQCCLVHICQPGLGVRTRFHDRAGILRQECLYLQPCHLHLPQQTGTTARAESVT